MPQVPLPLVAARPSLLIDGQSMAELSAALTEMRVDDRHDGMARCELQLGNWGIHQGQPGYTLFDRDKLEFGKRLEVRLGDTPLFQGRISAIEGRFPEGGAGHVTLGVLAEDALQALRTTRRTRCFSQCSDADAVRQIAGDHGLQTRIDLPGPTHPVLAQLNQSDLAFLRDRMRAAGGDLWLEGDTLHAATRGGHATGQPVELAYGSNLEAFQVRADLATQHTSLYVSGWNVSDKQAIREQAAASVLAGELNGGESGPDLLNRTLGERSGQVAHLNPTDADEARALAENWMRQMGRRFVTGHGAASANAAIRVGRLVTLRGLGPLFDGDYAVTATCHAYDARRGLRTEFQVERPAIGRP